MLGAIIGDIVGSVYEWRNIKTKDFPLFREDCFFTDDTVMTIATADAIMNGGSAEDFIDAYKKWGRLYPNAGYGGRFGGWVFSDDREPYNSWGNGSAMRVSPFGWMMDCGFCARAGMWPTNGREGAKRSAEVTHNHPEGIKGALTVADAIFMCRFYAGGFGDDMGNAIKDEMSLAEWKAKIKAHIEREYGYDLSKTLDEIRPTYRFNESCQDTVPQAIIAFLESADFEGAIRNAISLGGDSDTLAAITGSIAEAAYGAPDWIREKALNYLEEPLREMFTNMGEIYQEKISKDGMSEVVIRRSKATDLPAILDIYADARKFMAANGNPAQWKNWYPPQEMVERDVSPGGHGYVCEEISMSRRTRHTHISQANGRTINHMAPSTASGKARGKMCRCVLPELGLW